MSGITTHVLDTSAGRPAAQVPIVLEREHDGAFREIGRGETDQDGRLRTLTANGPIEIGTYRLRFAIQEYFAAKKQPCFYPSVDITFHVADASQHYHMPLLVSPFGYSTYRGSLAIGRARP